MPKQTLAELEEQAVVAYKKYQKHWQDALNEACAAGQAFSTAHATIMVEHEKGWKKVWGDWQREFARKHGISERVIRQCMQIALHWHKPVMAALRTKGTEPRSIAGFLKIIRAATPEDYKQRQQREDELDAALEDDGDEGHDERDAIRQAIREEFAARLRDLDRIELGIVERSLDYLLDKFQVEVRETVCMVFEDAGYYDTPEEADEREQEKRDTRKKGRDRSPGESKTPPPATTT